MESRLRELRIRAGLTQTTLAARAGLSPKTVQRYESGQSQPTTSRLEAICHALGIPPAEFMGWQAPGVDEPVVTDEGAYAPALPLTRVVGDPVPPAHPVPPQPGTRAPDAGVPLHYR